MSYLINKYSSKDVIEKRCECCNVKYQTNINRSRCSKSCARTMKNERRKSSESQRPKFKKEKKLHYVTNVFGFTKAAVY